MTRSSPRPRGFTMVELLIVMVILAIAVAAITLSLRDPAATQLEREAARLTALLESARTEARSFGIVVRWEPVRTTDVRGEVKDFQFVGLPPSPATPTRWLNEGVSADVFGARALVLGPEPMIGPQKVLLSLGSQRLVLSTDGLGPFVVSPEAQP